MYCQPHDQSCPIICMDEKPHQLLEQVGNPIPMSTNHPLREDGEYVRNGTCSIFVFLEPLTGWCRADAKKRRTSVDWAGQIQQLLEVDFPDAPKIRLVMDNLNTHVIASLYKAFAPKKARELAKRLEIHYTPKHGSWLNMAEIQISVLARQCLSRRIPALLNVNTQLSAWQADRRDHPIKVNWQFTIDDAHIKLKHLYPII